MIKKYGQKMCLKAYELYGNGSMGASGVGYMLNVHTNTADALINSGREILSKSI